MDDDNLEVDFTFFDKLRILFKIKPYYDERIVCALKLLKQEEIKEYIFSNGKNCKKVEKAIKHPYIFSKECFEDDDIEFLEEGYAYNISKNNPDREKNFIELIKPKFSKKEIKQFVKVLSMI